MRSPTLLRRLLYPLVYLLRCALSFLARSPPLPFYPRPATLPHIARARLPSSFIPSLPCGSTLVFPRLPFYTPAAWCTHRMCSPRLPTLARILRLRSSRVTRLGVRLSPSVSVYLVLIYSPCSLYIPPRTACPTPSYPRRLYILPRLSSSPLPLLPAPLVYPFIPRRLSSSYPRMRCVSPPPSIPSLPAALPSSPPPSSSFTYPAVSLLPSHALAYPPRLRCGSSRLRSLPSRLSSSLPLKVV